MNLHVALIPEGSPQDSAVVIDVLRMTTTAGVLAECGLDELFVVAELTEAKRCAQEREALLLGERHGVKFPGASAGNSPLEYLSQSLTGQRAVLCTSNGSKAVESAGEASRVFLGCINNAAAVAEAALAAAQAEIVLICAGTAGKVSLDDLLGAGCIAREITARRQVTLTDSAKLTLKLIDSSPDLERGLRDCYHGGLLVELGFAEDITFAAKLNRSEVVLQRSSRSPSRFTRVL